MQRRHRRWRIIAVYNKFRRILTNPAARCRVLMVKAARVQNRCRRALATCETFLDFFGLRQEPKLCGLSTLLDAVRKACPETASWTQGVGDAHFRSGGRILTTAASQSRVRIGGCHDRMFYPMFNRSRPLLLGVKKGKSRRYELAHKTHSARRKIHFFEKGHARRPLDKMPKIRRDGFLGRFAWLALCHPSRPSYAHWSQNAFEPGL